MSIKFKPILLRLMINLNRSLLSLIILYCQEYIRQIRILLRYVHLRNPIPLLHNELLSLVVHEGVGLRVEVLGGEGGLVLGDGD